MTRRAPGARGTQGDGREAGAFDRADGNRRAARYTHGRQARDGLLNCGDDGRGVGEMRAGPADDDIGAPEIIGLHKLDGDEVRDSPRDRKVGVGEHSAMTAAVFDDYGADVIGLAGAGAIFGRSAEQRASSDTASEPSPELYRHWAETPLRAPS